jgi:hypothetical protein
LGFTQASLPGRASLEAGDLVDTSCLIVIEEWAKTYDLRWDVWATTLRLERVRKLRLYTISLQRPAGALGALGIYC